MFILSGECLLCSKPSTPKRQHWCDIMGYIPILSVLKACNIGIHTSSLIDFLIMDKQNHPMWMSKTRAADFVSRFAETGIITIKPDTIDPRKNRAGMGEKGLMIYEDIQKLYNENLERLAKNNGKIIKERINYIVRKQHEIEEMIIKILIKTKNNRLRTLNTVEEK